MEHSYKPLVRPDVTPAPMSRFGRFFAQIPILGWSWAATRQKVRWRPAYKQILAQMEERQIAPSLEVWGNDPKRRELAQYIAREVKQYFRWPNDYFIPEDSVWVMLFPPYDDLETVELMMDIEDRLKITIPKKEAIRISEMTFGEFVDYLLRASEAQRCS